MVKYTDAAVHSLTCHTATGTHMPYRITQCYVPPDRGDIPAVTPAEAGTRLSDPGGMQGCVDPVGWFYAEMVYPPFLQCFDAVGWAAGRASGL